MLRLSPLSASLSLAMVLSLLPLSAAVAQTAATVESVTSTISSTAQKVDSATQTVDQATKAADSVKKVLGQDSTPTTTNGLKQTAKTKALEAATKDSTLKDAAVNAALNKGGKGKDAVKAMPEKAQKYGNSLEHRMDTSKKGNGKKN